MITRLGPYPIEREIGRGGMGVVYLGRDTRLGRPVAIKVLPDLFARDPERLARFEREARLLAALTHPHIAGIYGLEEADGVRFLALEYVEGETLAEHLARGPLSLDETLEVCGQIAGALEAAHEAGIIHRDLKPGNVKLTPAGQVKVLDFGLARGPSSGSDSSPDLTQSPTLTRAATGAGVVLGTAAYMSPEQARGKIVDRRTDIWSFGCVLYECLTGTQAFAGETVSDVIAVILQGQPDWSKLPAGTPEKLRALLQRCLEKDARRRLRDIGDARIELEELQGARRSGSGSGLAAAAAAPPMPARPPWRAIAIGAALALAGALGGAAVMSLVKPAGEAAPMRYTIQAPSNLDYDPDAAEFALSPDGRTLAFVGVDSTGERALWVRPLASFDAHPLPGTRNPDVPFWSPDSRDIGFFADGKLQRIRLDGGTPQIVCEAATGRGATWNRRGIIVFAGSPTGPLYQVPASGGTPVAVTTLDARAGETAHRWPCFLPDGEHFVFTALPEGHNGFRSFVGSLNGRQRQPLLESGNAPFYAEPGYLIFLRNEALQAQRFDAGSRRLQGEPFPVGGLPGTTFFSGAPCAGASSNGVLAWLGSGSRNLRFVWLDRGGRVTHVLGVPQDRWEYFTISPDGRKAAAERHRGSGEVEIWIVDLEREVANPLAFGGQNFTPLWSPDGSRIAYAAIRGGPRDIYLRPADGSGSETLLYHSNVPFKTPSSWTPDGRSLLYMENGDRTGWNLMLIPASGGRPQPWLATPFNEQNAVISPDGRWVLYVSDETGSTQEFVQSFPALGKKQQVSKNGTIIACWTRGGREILLFRPDRTVVSIPVEPGPDLKLGTPVELFRVDASMGFAWPVADGRRFLATLPADRTPPGISIAVNWLSARER